MTKVAAPHHLPNSHAKPEEAVVRTATAIPTMERAKLPQEQPVPPATTVCTGRCGHCSVNPCQLHAQLAFRI